VLTVRSFFGVNYVERDPAGRFHELIHGSTVHGRQFIAAERHCEPLAYYHRKGPLGSVFQSLRPRRVGVIGLGTGAMIAYANPGQTWTFFEIDPAVIRVAQDTNLFWFLAECAAAPPRLVTGDARLKLARENDATFDLLVLDAFSSDAIPVHLLTREAMQLYLRKLAPTGVMALHISNRYLELGPVAGNLARDAALVAWWWDDVDFDPDNGRDQSTWVVLARRSEDLGGLDTNVRWSPLEERPSLPVWTDDYSNILRVFKWRLDEH
jgi:SAM-dependent methyltransferase